MKIKVYIIAIVAMLLSAVTLSASSPSRVTIPLNSDWQVYPVEAPDGGEAEYISLPHSWQSELGSYGQSGLGMNYVRVLEVRRSILACLIAGRVSSEVMARAVWV